MDHKALTSSFRGIKKIRSKKYIFLTVLLFGIITQKSHAQSSTAFNIYNPAYYLGYSALFPGTLNFATSGTSQMTLHTSGDLDILGSTNGYMINGQYALWLPTPGNNNTWVGYSGNSFGDGIEDAYVGYKSGYSSTIYATECSFLGDYTGYYNQGAGQTFIGFQAGYNNVNGDFNTYTGYEAGYSAVNDGDLCFMGVNSGFLTNGSGGQDAFFGALSGQANTTGGQNTFIGDASAPNAVTASSSVALGFDADIKNNGTNEIAIGSTAIANTTNTMILGNNSVNVGIGMSNITGGPTNKLELSYSSLSSSTYTSVVAPVSTFTAVGAGTATGASGLQFRDLTAGSTQYSYTTNQGFLTVDNSGNVVYMQPPPAVVSGTGSFGVCPAPGMINNEGLDLSGYNLYFVGNNSGSSKDNVLIGLNCGAAAPAKLSILQASGSNNTLGIALKNTDLPSGNIINPTKVVGIASQILTGSGYYNVAGWFEADHTLSISTVLHPLEYALFVPYFPPTCITCNATSGGTVDIGFQYALDHPDYLLDVNGYGRTLAGVIPSDSIIKRNVSAFKYGIKAVRNLNPVTYKYNGIGGFDSTKTFIGVIAQNLQRNVPNGVVRSLITTDTITSDTETIMNVYEEAVMYTAINAIKQVDSAVRSNAHIDSNVSNTMWSLNGNALTTPSFVGTTNANPLQFKVDGAQSGWMDYGTPYTAFLGYESGNVNTGIDNQGFGYEALLSNTTGTDNTAVGYKALLDNVTGGFNTAIGSSAMQLNTGIYNTGIGYKSLYNNTGSNNSAVGYYSLVSNTSGYDNVAFGIQAGYLGTTAKEITAIGAYSLNNNTGNWNTALGYEAGLTNTSGTENTFVGLEADANAGTYNNSTALGYAAQVTASNQIDIGNTSVATIQGQVNWSTYSDRRIKNSIQQNVPGLTFINKLQPVTYHLNIHQQNTILGIVDSTDLNDTGYWNHKYDIENVVFSGLIAQQVDSAAQACSYNFSGVKKPVSSGGLYGLSYADFVVPLIKSVQQLSAKNDSLTSSVDSLRSMRSKLDSVQNTLDSLRSAFQSMQTCLAQLCADNHSGHHKSGSNNSGGGDSNSTTNVQDVTLSSENAPLLYQNMPNPFSTGTKINYYLPQGTMGASIVFYDNYGNQIKTVQLSQTGNGTLNITPENLSNGIYSYSLMVNGNVIDTKRMVLQK